MLRIPVSVRGSCCFQSGQEIRYRNSVNFKFIVTKVLVSPVAVIGRFNSYWFERSIESFVFAMNACRFCILQTRKSQYLTTKNLDDGNNIAFSKLAFFPNSAKYISGDFT
jgi:hypothetical protein